MRTMVPAMVARPVSRVTPTRTTARAPSTAELAVASMTHLSSALMASGPLVLIVEDDPETRHFYTAAFERGGFETDQAHNGHQALAKAFDSHPDLILTDIA